MMGVGGFPTAPGAVGGRGGRGGRRKRSIFLGMGFLFVVSDVAEAEALPMSP